MSLIQVLGVLGAAFFLFVVGLQLLVRWRSKALIGQAVPPLPGEVGRKVARSKHALLYFFSPGCAACRPITPVVKELERRNRAVFAIDISRDLELARALKVMATPSAIEVADGAIVGYHVGQLPRQVVERFAS